MSFSKNHIFAVAVTFVAIGCSSSQGRAVDPVPAGPPLVQPGDGYVMYYADNTGIRLRNTGARIDSVLLSAATDVQAKPSPDRDAIAVSFRRGGSAHLILVDAVTGAVSDNDLTVCPPGDESIRDASNVSHIARAVGNQYGARG